MDQFIPSEMTGALEGERRKQARRRSRFRVRTAEQELPVLELTANGFVIEADGRPRLRGYTDIFLGDERVLHGLVICSWTRDGLIGYEFKRDSTNGRIRVDHEPPKHSGLLSGPT